MRPQSARIIISLSFSDAYSDEQIRFEWDNVELVAGMVLSQYDLIATPKFNISHRINNGEIFAE